MMTLYKDPNLKILNTKVNELQKQYDEVQATVCSTALAQRLTKFHEGKQLLTQVEEAQKKEIILKARLGPWLEEAYQVTMNIQEKLMGLQQTQQMMKLAIEGPTTEQRVEEFKQVATQSTFDVAVVQVELGDLHSKIRVPTK